jgi:hypothetical protein
MEEDDDLLALAVVLEQEERYPLTDGAVLRLMRNLMVDGFPTLACLELSDGTARLWDGQRAVDAMVSCALEIGGIYRLDNYSNDRREGVRQLRVFAATQLGNMNVPSSVIMHDEVVVDAAKLPALRVALELANVFDVSVCQNKGNH